MPNRMDRRMRTVMGMQAAKGVQDYYRMKMGYRTPQFQVEQPTSVNVNTVPEYLQTKSSGGK